MLHVVAASKNRFELYRFWSVGKHAREKGGFNSIQFLLANVRTSKSNPRREIRGEALPQTTRSHQTVL